MQLYDLTQELNSMYKKLYIIEVKYSKLSSEIEELETKQQDPKIWNNLDESKKINQKLKQLKEKEMLLKTVKSNLADFKVAIELASAEPDFMSEQELSKLQITASDSLGELWISSLLNEEYDAGDAIIMLHSGAGGEEAQDWAEMLSRMYVRYATSKGYKVSLLDETPGEGAGIKSQTYLIQGDYAYGYLKAEKGVHRLVRLSPFDANNRRHTSFASLEVSPFIDDGAQDVIINQEDIVIDSYRSSGAGGQHVNKTESAIRITHKPTGIVVTCQNERSQTRNKEMALKLLASKLKERELAIKEKEKMEKLSLNKKIEWGSQIRSYVLHPYSLAKDHRTGHETANVQAVLDGNLQPFINEYLKVVNTNEQ